MRQRKRVRPEALARVLRRESESTGIPSDVLGSYTGSAMDGDRPIQDADDL